MNSLLARLSYKYNGKGIRNLMYYIAGGMLILYFCDWMENTPLAAVPALFSFSRTAILGGQVWRVISFIFYPEFNTLIFFLISLYFYVFLGNSLERQWGTFKFNIYYFVGMLGCIIAGFICGYATNTYLNLSIFLAFATLYPNYQVMIFFIIPVKMKYLAYIDVAIYGYQLISSLLFGDWATALSIVFSLANLLLFFGGDYWKSIRDFFRNRKRKSDFNRQYHNSDPY